MEIEVQKDTVIAIRPVLSQDNYIREMVGNALQKDTINRLYDPEQEDANKLLRLFDVLDDKDLPCPDKMVDFTEKQRLTNQQASRLSQNHVLLESLFKHGMNPNCIVNDCIKDSLLIHWFTDNPSIDWFAEKIYDEYLAKKNVLQSFAILLNQTQLNINAQDRDGNTALNSAIWVEGSFNNNIQIIKLLLNDNRTNPNIPNKLNRTPLHTAADRGDIVELLLNNKQTNPNIKDTNGRTPLSAAIELGAANGKILLSAAAIQFKKYVTVIELLLNDQRTDLTISDLHDQYNYLHQAALYGNATIAMLLLKHINPNIQSNSGNTALHIAAGHGHIEIVKLLLKHKDIDLNILNDYGRNPLHSAAFFHQIEVIRLLLATNKINFNQKGNYGYKFVFFIRDHEVFKEFSQYLKD